MSSLASGMERLMSMDDEAVHVRPGGSITLPLGLLGSLGWLLGISLWAELGMYRGRTGREARHRYACVCRQVERQLPPRQGAYSGQGQRRCMFPPVLWRVSSRVWRNSTSAINPLGTGDTTLYLHSRR